MPLPPLSEPANVPAEIKSICIFCGAGTGGDPIYVKHAEEVGKTLAENKYDLVYGGGSVGIMGAVAKAVLAEGGHVRGVVPDPLFRHGSKQIATTIDLVPDMHTRKRTMNDHSDAFVVFPGGFGTMEEMLEMITWSQLNVHSKPIILVNTKGYFSLFVQWVQLMVDEKFVAAGNRDIFVVCDTADQVLEALKTYKAPASRYGLDWIKTDPIKM
ncbi:hypothetical protein BCR42DRAFT_350269 [Absidia repens]|uniref:Cytokinin riboside 5'-monophosphate phosphoribohydrolase n=1 Tax=Absidia repens TaxID=90262 RepID=A0A1X2IJU7_9FUNG|nr:hypothetical protein BCR42DRAFT_350269 [Absidia repens]